MTTKRYFPFQPCFKKFDQRIDQRVRLGVFLFVLQLASLPLIGQFGSTVQYFPQIVINQGSITSFTIQNPSATDTITVDVQLYSPNGDPLDSQQVELAAGGTETVSFGEPGGVITRGSAVLSSSGKWTATEFFQIFLADLQPRVGVLPAVASKEMKLPGFVNDEFKTGIALLNPSSTDSTEVTFRLKDKAGQAVLSEATLMLSALQSEAAFLSDDLFFGASLSHFEVAVEVSASPLPVALVSLIQEASGDVAAVPAVVLGLPLRGEFPEGGAPNLIGGHEANSVADDVEAATIGGGGRAGDPNTVTADWGTVSGGILNTASGIDSTVTGGRNNEASGDYSFAGGRSAKALCNGCFVWADDNNFDFSSGTGLFAFDKRFLVRATGGVSFTTGIDGSGSSTAGVALIPGSGSWGSLSDRDAKEDFAPTDGRQVLERLVSIPISTWSYKAQQGKFRHIGPTAQDFSAAFEVGADDRHITTVDADGVALAAI